MRTTSFLLITLFLAGACSQTADTDSGTASTGTGGTIQHTGGGLGETDSGGMSSGGTVTGGAASGGAASGGAASGGAASGGAASGGAPAGGSASGGVADTGGDAASGGSEPSDIFEPPFVLGADISSVPEARDGGMVYRDVDGQEKPMLDILKNHGFNFIRLRTFVDPTAPYGYASSCFNRQEAYCGKTETIEMAQEVKAAEMGLQVDLHYSDTWADPHKQIVPDAWKDIPTIEGLADQVYSYTADMMDSLVAAGAKPDMIQVGNEITMGMLMHLPTEESDCWGMPHVDAPINGSAENWDNLALLIAAGIRAVRETDPNIKIILHIETDLSPDPVPWVQNALDRGLDFDVLGVSSYTNWHGPPSDWEARFNLLASTFPELEFVIAEYNPERTEANRIMRELPDGRGLGTFFWEPTLGGAWGDPMFDVDGNVSTARSDDFAEFDAIRIASGL